MSSRSGKTLGRRFAGQPIVLYRGKSGQVFALEDRCAHRQVPLHLGVVSGDELEVPLSRLDLQLHRQVRECAVPG